jgi:hypothetical protein
MNLTLVMECAVTNAVERKGIEPRCGGGTIPEPARIPKMVDVMESGDAMPDHRIPVCDGYMIGVEQVALYQDRINGRPGRDREGNTGYTYKQAS